MLKKRGHPEHFSSTSVANAWVIITSHICNGEHEAGTLFDEGVAGISTARCPLPTHAGLFAVVVYQSTHVSAANTRVKRAQLSQRGRAMLVIA